MADDRKVRVFISSTFRDMHAERDHLVTVVFPELRERCERLGLEFFDVDLRWGVPEKGVDGESANSWEYCRKWINEAKPFFICLLGQRYGWEPEPHQLKDETDQRAQAADRRSITDMEVHHALENDAHSRRCYFYLRQEQAPAAATEFVDPQPRLAKLDALKARVETCGRPFWHYPCRWTGSGFADMEAFGKKVLEDLWSGILRDSRFVSEEVWQQVLGADPAKDPRYTDEYQPVPEDIAEKLIPLAKPPPKSPIEAERDEMQRFADSRLRWFQGREQELKELLQFIANPAEAHDLPRLAVLAAQPGQGKSALMAKLAHSLTSPALPVSPSPRLFVVTHFVGATSQSSSSYYLVKRLNDELDASGITFPARPVPEGLTKEEPKLDFQSLCQRLWDRLGDYAGEKRIVILLDALNQLDDGHELGWLPYRLGPSVRVVVSCIDDATAEEDSREKKVLTALDFRHPKPTRTLLGPLSANDVRTIVTSYLKEYCKELDALHVDAICDEKKLPQARNPLYLLIMLAELRTLGGNDINHHVPALIADMARRHPDTVSLFHWVLERLEKAEGFGESAVRWWCLYLALGRVGMASRELSDLLVRKLGPDSAATAKRIERALRRYLQCRGEQWDFFHGQLHKAVMSRYGGKKDNLVGHRNIADYFLSITNPDPSEPWNTNQIHGLRDLPHHQIQAEDWEKLVLTIQNIFFLEAKSIAGMTFGIAEDFSFALQALPADNLSRKRIGLLHEALCRDIHFIHSHSQDYPQALFQCLWNTCWWYDCPAAESHYLEPEGGFRENPPWALPGSKLYLLLEQWRDARAQSPRSGNRTWARCLRPPSVPLNGSMTRLIRFSRGTAASAISSDGNKIMYTQVGRELTIYDVPTYSAQAGFLSKSGRIVALERLSDGNHFISICSLGTIRVWDSKSAAEVGVFHVEMGTVTTCAASEEGGLFAVGNTNGEIAVWNVFGGECIVKMGVHEGTVNAVTFSANNRYLATCGEDLRVAIVDLESGELNTITDRPNYSETYSKELGIDEAYASEIAASFGVAKEVTCLCFLPPFGDASYHVVAGKEDGSIVELFRWGRELRFKDAFCDSRVTALSVSKDGQRLISGSGNGIVQVWQSGCATPINKFSGHEGPVTRVWFLENAEYVGSCATDGTVRYWNLFAERSQLLLPGHKAPVKLIKISPDDRNALSYDQNCLICVWQLNSGECILHAGAWTSDSDLPPGAYSEEKISDVNFSRCGQFIAVKVESKVAFGVYPNPLPIIVNSSNIKIWSIQSREKVGIVSVNDIYDFRGIWAFNLSEKRVWRYFDNDSIRLPDNCDLIVEFEGSVNTGLSYERFGIGADNCLIGGLSALLVAADKAVGVAGDWVGIFKCETS